MKKMLGQNQLKERVSSLTRDTFPKTSLFVGGAGCGKHLFVSEYVLPILQPEVANDITDAISFEVLMEIEANVLSALYLINVDEITEKEQNVLLKFLEEPPENSNIVLLSSSTSSVLPTVLNRCIVFEFERYTEDELVEFCSTNGIDTGLIGLAYTPGMLLRYRGMDIGHIIDVCEKLLLSYNKISLTSLLMLSDKMNWGKDKDKWDSTVFLTILTRVCANLYANGKVPAMVYNFTSRSIGDIMAQTNIDKKRQFDRYLLDIRYERYR